jgi:hypothetical protein
MTTMRYRGIQYDTGVHFSPRQLSRETFAKDLVRYELTAIKRRLHANAVRLVGEDLTRMRFAAEVAFELGLSIFLQPWLVDAEQGSTLRLLAEAAEMAEQIRRDGADVVLVVGQEASLFTAGFIPGANVYERIDWMVTLRDRGAGKSAIEAVSQDLTAFLASATASSRQFFSGAVTYAAGTWEQIDWSPFDLVGLDYYRQSQTDTEYAQGLRDARRFGKPVLVTEIGCCAYEGADAAGGLGWDLLDEWAEGGPCWKSGRPPVRSEATQARYLTTQLSLFAGQEVDGVFVFTLSAPYLPHDPVDPSRDFDMTSFSLTKLFRPDTERGCRFPPWEPKMAFHAVSDAYARFESR